jgi:hypothetical protein
MSFKRVCPIMLPTNREAGLALELRRENVTCIIVSLPWEMIAPHEAQAVTNHGQSLERLAQRGGLSASEALAVLGGKKSLAMPHATAHRILGEMLLDWITESIDPTVRK